MVQNGEEWISPNQIHDILWLQREEIQGPAFSLSARRLRKRMLTRSECSPWSSVADLVTNASRLRRFYCAAPFTYYAQTMAIELADVVERAAEQNTENAGPARILSAGGGFSTTVGHIGAGDSDALGRIRVVAGQPGCGKSTVLDLARFAAEAAGEVVLAADALPPDTQALVELDDAVDSAGNLDQPMARWMKIWRVAILTSVASVLNASSELADRLPNVSTDDRAIIEGIGHELPEAARNRIVHPYRIIRELSFSNPRIDGSYWDDLERVLARVLAGTRVHGFLDALDDAADSAPAVHYQCQAGLVGELLRHERVPLGSTVRFATAVQKAILAFVPPAQAGLERVVEIHWDSESLLGAVGLALFQNADPQLPELERLIGVSSIENHDRGESTELLLPYLMRHTTGIPRDLLDHIGALANVKLEARERRIEFGSDDLRRQVGARAYGSGASILYHLGTSLLASMDIRGGDRNLAGLGRSVDDQLRMWLQALGDEVLPREEFRETTGVAFASSEVSSVLRLALEGRVIGACVPKRNPASRPLIEFSGRAHDPAIAAFATSHVGLNSCLLELVECRTIGPIAPEVRFI